MGWAKYHWFLEISLGLIFGSDKGKAATKRPNPASCPSKPRMPSVGSWGLGSCRLFSNSLVRTWLCKLLCPCCLWNTFIISLSWWFWREPSLGPWRVQEIACISSGLCSSWWDVSSSLLVLRFFSSPMCCSQLLLVTSTEKSAKGLLGTGLVQSGLWSGKMELSLWAAWESHSLLDQPLCDAF